MFHILQDVLAGYANLVLGSRNEGVHYNLECDESKLHIHKGPGKNVSGESETVWFVFTSDGLDP